MQPKAALDKKKRNTLILAVMVLAIALLLAVPRSAPSIFV